MNEFIARCQDQISGVLTGFDRLMFRGNLALNHEAGMKGYLWANGIAWKNYAAHVTLAIASQQRVKRASLASMEASNRPVRYRSHSQDSKEEMALTIARQDGITSGPVCAFTAVEPGFSWRVVGDRQTQKLQLKRAIRQCLFLYDSLDRCGIRVYERSSANLVSVCLLCLHEWPRVAQPPDG